MLAVGFGIFAQGQESTQVCIVLGIEQQSSKTLALNRNRSANISVADGRKLPSGYRNGVLNEFMSPSFRDDDTIYII